MGTVDLADNIPADISKIPFFDLPCVEMILQTEMIRFKEPARFGNP